MSCLAPCSSSNCKASSCPKRAAINTGVEPELLHESTCALALIKLAHTGLCPFFAANISDVLPKASAVSVSAPERTNMSTAGRRPKREARSSRVSRRLSWMRLALALALGLTTFSSGRGSSSIFLTASTPPFLATAKISESKRPSHFSCRSATYDSISRARSSWASSFATSFSI